MAHDLSLSYTRSDHMSPAGVALATVLHVAVALALWWVSPLHQVDQTTDDPIEVTMEQEVQPPPPPPAPPPAPEPPPPVQAVAPPPPPPAPPVQQTPSERLGLKDPPIGTTMDPRAPLSQPQADPVTPPTPGQQAAKPEPSQEANPEPPKEIVSTESAKEEPKPDSAKDEQQAALAPRQLPEPQPPPPPIPQPVPSLEEALPPVEAPPPPLTSREIPRPAPPPPPPPTHPKPQPQQAPQAQTPPPAPQRQLQASPLSSIPQQHAPAPSQQASRQAPSSSFVNPAATYGQRKAQEDYLWGVVRKISAQRYYPKSARENSEEGTVVALVTISRDGRLLNVSVGRSSGYPTLDNALLEVIRQAAPYPPLPNDIAGSQHTFTVPLNYRRNDR